MSEIRKMIREVNKYVILIFDYPEEAKKDCKNCIKDVEVLKRQVEAYIEKTSDDFYTCANKHVEVWAMNHGNIFSRFKRWLRLSMVNESLSKLSRNLAYAGILERNIEVILVRLNQFEAFCLH